MPARTPRAGRGRGGAGAERGGGAGQGSPAGWEAAGGPKPEQPPPASRRGARPAPGCALGSSRGGGCAPRGRRERLQAEPWARPRCPRCPSRPAVSTGAGRARGSRRGSRGARAGGAVPVPGPPPLPRSVGAQDTGVAAALGAALPGPARLGPGRQPPGAQRLRRASHLPRSSGLLLCPLLNK